MERYDYEEAIRNDIREYLEYKDVGYIDDNLRQELYDEMFVSDSVTGNASGSYTFSTWTAEENLCHNSELLREAIEEMGDGFKDPESNDVAVRCHLLSRCLSEVVEEWNEEHPEDDGDVDESDDSEDGDEGDGEEAGE